MKKLAIMIVALGTMSLQAQTDRTTNGTTTERNGDFSAWDANDDNRLSSSEFNENWDNGEYMNDWDRDRNGSVSEDEWNRGTKRYYGEVDGWRNNQNRDFSQWDQNQDGSLDEDEFREGTYSTWDENQDGRVDNEEYSSYYTYQEGNGRNQDNMQNDRNRDKRDNQEMNNNRGNNRNNRNR